ncbi:Transposase [Streptomyces sp. SceaMP-e96]|nr:Transposase [Streptomyces sp. SceaMP-e96]
MTDPQSVKTSTSVPAKSQGIDAGKKIVGRKRSIITDTLGLLPAVLVTAAGAQDSTAGQTLLDQTAADHPGLRKVWVDGGHRKHFIEHAATIGIDLEIVQRTPGATGFTPIPKRWAVERTYGWLMLHRRLARDYEAHPHRSEAMIHLAMTDLMARRLTGATPSPGATRHQPIKAASRDETTGRTTSKQGERIARTAMEGGG